MLKPIKGFTRYLISDNGQVYSNAKGKTMYPLKTFTKPDGYLAVSLWNDSVMGNKIRKTLLVHRIVAETFIPNIDNKPTVNHIDGNKTNNNVSNLEWATPHEQEVHSFALGLNYARKGEEANRAELTWDIVHYIRNTYPEKSVKELASMFDTTMENVYTILYNYTWVDKNYTPIMKHHISEDIVKYIRKHPNMKIKDFCKMFNLSYGTVYDIVTNRTWKGVI